MESARYLDCLTADATRLREVAARGLGEAVPSCPGWTVTDLVYHVAEVYLHKVETMRRGDWPSPWPLPELREEEPLALFDRALAELVDELTVRKAEEPSVTWYAADQTVGFWIRRMAQETVIHRVDAEQALAEPLARIPGDLAVDGIDEVLITFLAYSSHEWPEDYGSLLTSSDGRAVEILAGEDARWLVRATPAGIEVTQDAAPAGAMISGDPQDVLIWLWRRVPATHIFHNGDQSLVTLLHDLMNCATQ
ncbi:maleylpyruvate isomerase family mycothiol-dependent enzyme [Streptosporangiaceae bacterium NEAU-GS5]|nr:maleylpyruvate isomerase family mycothiol-dependent enzyme [Streptosporangiaceae bacterium NEAU-GS5]